MKRTLSFTGIFFMLVAMNAQEQEVPAIAEEQEEEKVIKVEIVKNSSFEAADSFGNNEFRVNFFDLLVLPGFHGYYERIIDENSSYGTGLFINFSDNLSSDIVQRRFAISPYYRLYFLNRKDYGAKGLFVELFSSFASAKDMDDDDLYDVYYDDFDDRDNIFRVSVGATIGRKWITRSGYTFEPFIGVGRYLDSQDSDGGNPEAHLRLGFSIGKRY
ncbi:MAG: hypothetical protein ACPG8J_01895 [Flavobacteriaceae bacterium]